MKAKLIILLLSLLMVTGCAPASESSTYVCDFSMYFKDYEKAEIEIELIYKDNDLLEEVNIQRFYFFDSTSSYQREYLMQDIQTFEAEGYKVELEVYDGYYEIITSIDYENLGEEYKAILVNNDGSVPLQESIDYLEANNCVLQ